MKIAIVNSSSFGQYFKEHLEELKTMGTVEFFKFEKDAADQELIDALNDFDYIIASVTPNFNRTFFENCPKLKIISRHGIGFNNIDIEAANDHKVHVTKVDAVVEKDAVAEQAVALLMALTRQVPKASHYAKTGDWLKRADCIGYQFQGKTLGVVGFGNIGSRVASIFKYGFNMRVIAYDAHVPIAVQNKINDIEFVDLETLAKEADFISLNAFLDTESYRILNKDLIATMKKHCLIVNTARGGLVDEAAILKAIQNNQIGGYAADVMEEEPILWDHPFFNEERILITPHTAAYTWECLRGMGEKCVSDLVLVHQGKRPTGEVTSF